MAQPTGRPRGRPPGSKNKSTLERERKEKEKVLNESRDEIVNEVVKKVEKMVDNKMDVTTPPRGDRGIVLGGFAGTYQKVAQKGQFSLLKSEQFGDRAYMVLLKGKKVVAKDIATMNDARVVKAIGRAHRKADASRISKNTPGEMEDKFNEAAHLLIDIADWCESQGLYVTVDKVRTLVNRIDSAFEVFYDEVMARMPSEDEFEKSKKSTVRKSSKLISKGTSARDEEEYRTIQEVHEGLKRLNDKLYNQDLDIIQTLISLKDKWESGFGDVTIPRLLDSADDKWTEFHETVFRALIEAERFKEGQYTWSPTTMDGNEEGTFTRKSHVKKDTYGDNLSPEDEVRARTINSLARSISNSVNEMKRNLYYIANGFENVSGFDEMKGLARQFGDVEVIQAIDEYQRALVEYANAIKDIRIRTPDADDFIMSFEDLIYDKITEFIRGNYVTPRANDIDETPVDADYDLSQYEIKSKKGSQSKAPVKDDRGSIGIDIEKMIRTKKESKEKPETDLDEPIEAPDEPPVTQGEKPETNPDEPIEAPSEPAVSDKGKDDDISSLESSAGPTVIANGNEGSELDIDIDLDDDEDLEKMMARKERMQSQAEPPGRTQPFSNNYRTVQMGAGKFNPMDMPKGRNVKP